MYTDIIFKLQKQQQNNNNNKKPAKLIFHFSNLREFIYIGIINFIIAMWNVKMNFIKIPVIHKILRNVNYQRGLFNAEERNNVLNVRVINFKTTANMIRL